MKLHVMHDPSGRIVAAVRIDEDRSTAHRGGRRLAGVRPVLKPGHSAVDIELPAEHAHLTFHEACRRLYVDTTEGRPRLVHGSADRRK